MPTQTAFVSTETFTQKEFKRWLDERPASDINHYELLRGRIVMSPPAGWPHGSVGANILAPLATFVRTHGLGQVLDSSAGYDLPSGDTVEPDISFIMETSGKLSILQGSSYQFAAPRIAAIISRTA